MRRARELRQERDRAVKIFDLERRVVELERRLNDPGTAARAAQIVQEVISGRLRAPLATDVNKL